MCMSVQKCTFVQNACVCACVQIACVCISVYGYECACVQIACMCMRVKKIRGMTLFMKDFFPEKLFCLTFSSLSHFFSFFRLKRKFQFHFFWLSSTSPLLQFLLFIP